MPWTSSAGTECEPGLAARLHRAVGFRNVLVHDYVDVDDDIVTRRLEDLGDLRIHDLRGAVAREVLG